jgi:hypothetical protein
MASELLAGLGMFKSMLDMARGLKEMNDAATRNAAAIELQTQILAAQEQQATLIERVRQLEQEVARFETWEAEKQRYKLEQLPPGVFVYSLKPEMAQGEPQHQICAKCYQHGKKAFLHSGGRSANSRERLTCNECGTTAYVGHVADLTVERGPRFR